MPARCGSCGNTVLTYGQYWRMLFRSPGPASSRFWSDTPHVKCAHCGAEVTQRHYRVWGFGLNLLFALLFAAALILLGTSTERWVAWVALVVVLLGKDFAGFRVLPWDPVQPSVATPPTSPPAV